MAYPALHNEWELTRIETNSAQRIGIKKIHCAKHIYARFRAVQQGLTGLAVGEV